MKGLYQKLLSVTAAAAIFCSAAAVSVSAKSGVIYENDFDTAEKVAELELVGDGPLDGTPTMAFDESRGEMYFEAWGSRSGFLLPEEVTAANFVMEADVIYEKKPDYRDRGINYGFIFGYQDAENFSSVVSYPLNGNVIMNNGVNGVINGRNAENGRGVSFTVADNEVAHLKLIVNEGLMEFFINDELCYTYYSDTQQDKFNDFTKSGRLGLWFQADKTMMTVKDLVVREVEATDVAYYTNAYMSGEDTLEPLSDFAPSYFVDNSFAEGYWGWLKYNKAEGSGWDNTGMYLPIKLEGNYTVDMNFAFEDPFNATRYMGFGIGLNTEADGGCTYTIAGVQVNGNMVMEQKTISNTSETTIAGSEATYNSCVATIPEDKKNPGVDMSAPDAERYFVSYMPNGYNSDDYADIMPRRHNMHVEVVDGTISFTFEGRTMTLTPDVNSTDGYFALRSAGTGARIYSLRVAPYKEPEPETTMATDYVEITPDYADVDVIINDGENLVDENTRAILSVYKDGVLSGIGVETVPDNGEVSFSIDVAPGAAETETAKVMLWDFTTMEPLTEAMNVQ